MLKTQGKMGRNLLCKEKLEDFIAEVQEVRRECLKQGRCISTSSAINIAVNRPAPKFYITEEEAIRHINKIMNNKDLGKKSDTKKEMYHDIYKYYVAQQTYNNYNGIKEYKRDIIDRIINSTAPKFYITSKFATAAINYYYKQHSQNKKL